jgi:hypothetical protein
MIGIFFPMEDIMKDPSTNTPTPKEYETPKLTEFGTITELTFGEGGPDSDGPGVQPSAQPN